jgi:hypothetical protein
MAFSGLPVDGPRGHMAVMDDTDQMIVEAWRALEHRSADGRPFGLAAPAAWAS